MKRREFLAKSAYLSAILTLGGSFHALFAHTNNTKGEAMQLTQTAQANFTKLFGEKIPTTLAEIRTKDSEFFSAFLNFTLDDSLSQSKLSIDEYIKVVLAALIAIPSIQEYEVMLHAAVHNKIHPTAIKEILYQATPYVGYGRVSEFLALSNKVLKEYNISLPLAPQSHTTRQNRQEKGLEIQRQIFGSAIDKANAAAPDDSKHIRAFLSANCFGDYYTRGGLDLRFRELLTFIYLSAMGGADAQLTAHVSGNITMGNDRARLINVITALIPYIGYPRALNALSAIDSVTLKK